MHQKAFDGFQGRLFIVLLKSYRIPPFIASDSDISWLFWVTLIALLRVAFSASCSSVYGKSTSFLGLISKKGFRFI